MPTRILGYLCLSLAGLLLCSYVHILKQRVNALEHTQRTLTTLSTEFVQRTEFDQALRQARLDTLHRLQELHREDSPDGTWLRQSIPVRVREAYFPDRAVPDPVSD